MLPGKDGLICVVDRPSVYGQCSRVASAINGSIEICSSFLSNLQLCLPFFRIPSSIRLLQVSAPVNSSNRAINLRSSPVWQLQRANVLMPQPPSSSAYERRVLLLIGFPPLRCSRPGLPWLTQCMVSIRCPLCRTPCRCRLTCSSGCVSPSIQSTGTCAFIKSVCIC